MQFTVNLDGSTTWARQQSQGSYLVIIGTGAASSVELRIIRGTSAIEEIRTAGRGFKARVPTGFDAIELRAAAPCAVELVISDGLVDFDFLSGAAVAATIQGLPLQVTNDRGSPGNLLYVSGVSLADSPAVALSDNVAISASATLATVAAANSARRAIRVCNLGPDPVAIGGAALTWAKRCVVLQPGDTMLEDRAANLALYAITDTAKAASVTWQGVTS